MNINEHEIVDISHDTDRRPRSPGDRNLTSCGDGEPRDDEYWMRYSLELARRAEDEGEIPVGAVLLLNGEVVGEGWNNTIGKCDPTAHAEILALRGGGSRIRNHRLLNTVLYVTLEPCMMCVGAIVHARIGRLTFGARNTRKSGPPLELLRREPVNHRIECLGGVLAEECALRLINFFRLRRSPSFPDDDRLSRNGPREFTILSGPSEGGTCRSSPPDQSRTDADRSG